MSLSRDLGWILDALDWKQPFETAFTVYLLMIHRKKVSQTTHKQWLKTAHSIIGSAHWPKLGQGVVSYFFTVLCTNYAGVRWKDLSAVKVLIMITRLYCRYYDMLRVCYSTLHDARTSSNT